MDKLVLRNLLLEDASSMLMLQNNAANPDLFVFRDIKSLEKACLNDRTIGLIKNGDLIAFSIFAEASDIEKSYVNLLPSDKVGKFSGSVVSCCHKGNGIQKYFLISHVRYAKENGFGYVMSYAHPENHASIKNITNAGLSSQGVKYLPCRDQEREIFLNKI